MKQLRTLHLSLILVFGFINPAFSQSADGEDTFVLNAHPGPANNGGSPNWGMFMNLIADPSWWVTITHMSTASTATAGAQFNVEIFTRSGNALGGPVGSGPGSSSAGWTSIGTVTVTQGPVGSGISELFAVPPFTINPGDTTGVALKFTGVGPRYFGTGTPPYAVYSSAHLTLITGDARSAPFTPTGSFFSSRALCGVIHYDAIIPVELTSFTASVIDMMNENAVELNWSTASELNNSGFSVERKSVNSEWTSVGFVDGNGTTTQTHNYSYIDKGMEPGSYTYRLKQIDFDGSYTYSAEVEVDVAQPGFFQLVQNYPNPFNPTTTISYHLAAASTVSLKVFDVLGKEVATLIDNELKEAGIHNYQFSSANFRMPSGVYFYRLQAGDFVDTKKMILMK